MERIHLQKLEITLEDNKTLYQIGDSVKGNLNIVQNGVLLLSNVKIGLVCVAEVKWVENPGTQYHNRRELLDLSYEIPEECKTCNTLNDFEIIESNLQIYR